MDTQPFPITLIARPPILYNHCTMTSTALTLPRYRGQSRPTIGLLSGWQVYSGTVHSFLSPVFRGAAAAAQDYDCNLLIGCGV